MLYLLEHNCSSSYEKLNPYQKLLTQQSEFGINLPSQANRKFMEICKTEYINSYFLQPENKI